MTVIDIPYHDWSKLLQIQQIWTAILPNNNKSQPEPGKVRRKLIKVAANAKKSQPETYQIASEYQQIPRNLNLRPTKLLWILASLNLKAQKVLQIPSNSNL